MPATRGAKTSRAAPAAARRPGRSSALAVALLAGGGLLLHAASRHLAAFCGASLPASGAVGGAAAGGAVDVARDVAMGTKARKWQAGRPNNAIIKNAKRQMPSVSNMKDQYYVLWVRSPRIKQWKAINIVSGTEAAKGLKEFTDNDIGKALGANKLANDQIVKALGMNIYGQKEEVTKQAIQMHPSLQYAKELQFGFKEIQNNTLFNKRPDDLMNAINITVIPPEDELKNVLDKAGEALNETTTSVSKVGDNIKGFLSGMR